MKQREKQKAKEGRIHRNAANVRNPFRQKLVDREDRMAERKRRVEGERV